MTKNITVKQERFAQKYVELGNASDAYRQAYDASGMKDQTINNKAHILLKKGEIRARVKELQAQHLKRHEVTMDSITEELEEARQVAKLERQASSMVSASMGKAKIHGLEKDPNKKIDVNVSWHNKTREEKLEIAQTLALLLRKGSE